MSDLLDRPGRVRGSTRKVGVIGWPIEHTLSPVIHNAAFVALGMDWVYVPLPVATARLPAALDGLGALGFAGAELDERGYRRGSLLPIAAGSAGA